MANTNNNTGTHCGYPGEFIAPSFTLTELQRELSNTHQCEAKPFINLAEEDNEFIIEVTAPGLKKEDFQISINQNVLFIAALHKETTVNKLNYSQREFNYYCFERNIVLPGNVDADFVDATYQAGILYIRLFKSKNPVRNQVERIVVY